METLNTTAETKEVQILKEINISRAKNEEWLQKETERIQYYNSKVSEKLSLLETKLPLIINALKNQGLEIDKLSYYFHSENKWIDGSSSMSVSINAISTSGKFKFILFNGYDSRGRGKNHDRLIVKRNKIQESFIKDGIKMQVNEYSLEVKNQSEEKRVLISFGL